MKYLKLGLLLLTTATLVTSCKSDNKEGKIAMINPAEIAS